MADEESPQIEPEADEPASEASESSESEPLSETEGALHSVEQAAEEVSTAAEEALDLPEFSAGAPEDGVAVSGMRLLDDVTLHVKLELGRTRMYVEDVLRLGTDSVIELDKAAGDPVDIYVNDRHVARGEVLVLNESFCVRVSEIIRPSRPEESAA